MRAFTFVVLLFGAIFLFTPKKDHGKVTVFYEEQECSTKSLPAPSDPMDVDSSSFVTYPSMGMSYVSYGKTCGHFPVVDSLKGKVTGIEFLNTEYNIIAFRIGNNMTLPQALKKIEEFYVKN